MNFMVYYLTQCNLGLKPIKLDHGWSLKSKHLISETDH